MAERQYGRRDSSCAVGCGLFWRKRCPRRLTVVSKSAGGGCSSTGITLPFGILFREVLPAGPECIVVSEETGERPVCFQDFHWVGVCQELKGFRSFNGLLCKYRACVFEAEHIGAEPSINIAESGEVEAFNRHIPRVHREVVHGISSRREYRLRGCEYQGGMARTYLKIV